MDQLFGRLKLAYPNFLYGETDLVPHKKFWLQELGYYQDQDITKAAGQMTFDHPAKAPTVGQFKILCRRAKAERTPDEPEVDYVCGVCLSHLKSQHHQDECLNEAYA